MRVGACPHPTPLAPVCCSVSKLVVAVCCAHCTKYCLLPSYRLQDAYLPQRLLDKLMYAYNYVEMARVTGGGGGCLGGGWGLPGWGQGEGRAGGGGAGAVAVLKYGGGGRKAQGHGGG